MSLFQLWSGTLDEHIERMIFELRRLEWVRQAVADVKGRM